ncbi:unnamed protein product [Agarophyton chilense]
MKHASAQSDEAAEAAKLAEPLEAAAAPSVPTPDREQREQRALDPHCVVDFLRSPALDDYRERKEAGLISSPLYSHAENPDDYSDVWALAVDNAKANELKNQYSRVGILIEHNFDDFELVHGCAAAYRNASIEEIALLKAKAVYDATGLPAISELHDMTIEAPKSSASINKSMQHGYYTRDVSNEANSMIERVRPISDENRVTGKRQGTHHFCGGGAVGVAGSE